MHQPVLLKEVLELLNVKKGGRYVDGTLGLAGHAEGILRRQGPNGKLLGLDVDPGNIALAKNRLQPFEDQTITRQVNFRGLQGVLQQLHWNEVDGMIFDLGISSQQLDDPIRGFSFQQEGPLDMRMDPTQKETALTLLQQMDEEELANHLFVYGESRGAKRISRYLKHDLALNKIQTTSDLATFCERVIGRTGKTHPATRLFLTLRSLVNRELENLDSLLQTAPQHLAVQGRLAIITFHSLEDKKVKTSFKNLSQEGFLNKKFSLVNKKPVVPTEEEIQLNPRARSAKLRVLERIL